MMWYDYDSYGNLPLLLPLIRINMIINFLTHWKLLFQLFVVVRIGGKSCTKSIEATIHTRTLFDDTMCVAALTLTIERIHMSH